MKKTLLTLVAVLLTTITFSQTLYSLTVGVRDNSSEDFYWGETRMLKTEIPIKFNGNDITIMIIITIIIMLMLLVDNNCEWLW